MGKIKELLAQEQREHLDNMAWIKHSAKTLDIIKSIQSEWAEWSMADVKSYSSKLGFLWWQVGLFLGDNQSAKKQGFQFLEHIMDKYSLTFYHSNDDFSRKVMFAVPDSTRVEIEFSGGKCKRVPQTYYEDVCE